MDVHENWAEIRRVLIRARRNNLHHSFASVTADGYPQVTPIGSLWLHPDEPRGIYLDVYNRQLAENLNQNPHVAVLAVDASYLMWIGAALRGRFTRMPGMRLLGTAGSRRRPQGDEVSNIQKMFRRTRFTRGYRLLWSRIERVRDISFTAAYPVRIGPMTKDLLR